jgi:hypothetical protein
MLKETYFAMLEKTRKENPNAYFIAVSRSIPKGCIIERWTSLAPCWNLLNDYKRGLSWEEYTERFETQIMNDSQALRDMGMIKAMSKIDDVFLVCWEAHGKNCHRHLLIEMIEGKKKEKQATLLV